MDNRETKYCIYCGEEIPINAKKCKYCYEWVDNDSITRNHNPNTYEGEIGPEELVEYSIKPQSSDEKFEESKIVSRSNSEKYSKIMPIRKLSLLMLFTFGIYGYYWYYKNSSYLKDYLGKDIKVGWRTFLMFIPLAQIIVFYQLIEDMKNFIEGERIECYSSGWNTLIWIFCGFGSNVLGMWPLINVQESINELWRIREPNLPIKRGFTNGEIVIMVLGIIFIILLIFFYMILFFAIVNNFMGYPYY